MFYPQAMTEIELIVPARDLLAVTRVLSNEGVFQQAESSYLGLDTNTPRADNSWNEKAATFAALERRVLSIMQVLNIEEDLPLENEFEAMVEVETAQPLVEKIEQEVKNTSDQLANEHKRLEQLQSTLNQLEPISDLAIDVGVMRDPRYLFSILGMLPTTNVDRLETSLRRTPHVFLPLRQVGNSSVAWLAGSKENADILDRAARSAYLNPVNLPDGYQGTPGQIIATIQDEINQAKQHITALEKKLVDLKKTYQGELENLLWSIRSSRMMADAIVRFGRMQYTYLVVGWVLSSHLEDLMQRIKQVSKETLIEASPLKRGSVQQEVPVALNNPRFMLPFQNLVTTYARPHYYELDPTFLIAVTFPLLFGAMFGDVGHGLVLALLGWLISSKKVKALNSLTSLGGLIMVCGAVAMVFGFLYGSIFGVEDLLPALWLRPMENIMEILILAIGAGVVLLIAGFFIGMFNSWVVEDWGGLLFDRNGIAGFVMYISLILLIVGLFTKREFVPVTVLYGLVIVSGIVIMFSEVLKRLIEGHRPLIVEGIGTYAIQSFFELFETLIGFLSNSLSYVRVGAFAVAHAGLSAVIFILADLFSPGHGVGYWIVVALGNVFIIGFEGLIVGIQTMRLEYYEFFSKFFKGGGTLYRPLSLHPEENE